MALCALSPVCWSPLDKTSGNIELSGETSARRLREVNVLPLPRGAAGRRSPPRRGTCFAVSL